MYGIHQIKASAGSGKTYTLTHSFLTLLEEGSALNDIVAITFTNAAAEEMRSRILFQLKKKALSGDRISSVQKAKALLYTIFHNYAALNVRTIDSLLLQIVRTASLPLGLAPDFQPVFSTEETIEPFLEILSNKARAGDRDLDRTFSDVIACLYHEGEAEGFRAKNKLEHLLALLFSSILLKQCDNLTPSSVVRAQYNAAWQSVQESAKILLSLAGDCKWQKRALTAIEGIASGKTKTLTSSYIQKESVAALFCKGVPLSSSHEQAFFQLKTDIEEYGLLSDAIRTMPFIELGKRMVAEYEASEKAPSALHTLVVPLLVQAIFEGLIPVEEALFRLGNSTKHLLIDEFQDTSDEQWHALSPLVENTLSEGGSFTYVGDIKQSIFSWRGGNPQLFDSLLDRKHSPIVQGVAETSVKQVVLPYNWRSRKEIVDFNNRLYATLENAQNVQEILSACLPVSNPVPEDYLRQAVKRITNAFHAMAQKLPSHENEERYDGYVELTEVEEESAYDALAEKIAQRHEKRQWSDMLVIVRTNDESTELAETLLSLGIPVVTENSLLLAHQPVLIESIAFLRFLLWRDETAFVTLLSGKLLKSAAFHDFSLSSFLDAKLSQGKNADRVFAVLYPDLWALFFQPFLEQAHRYSPYDLVCEWYAFLCIETRFPNDLVFFRRFLEVLHRAEEEDCGTISSFLEYWDNNNGDEKVPMPENMDAVRIMTIHKAKGLEAPVVFFPWKMKGVRTQDRVLFEETQSGLKLALRMSQRTRDAYYTDYMRIMAEYFNLLYVATTRPQEELYLIRIKRKNDTKDLLWHLCDTAGITFPSSFGAPCERSSQSFETIPLSAGSEEFQPKKPIRPMEWLPSIKIAHTLSDTLRAKARDMGLLFHSALEWIDLTKEGNESVTEAIRMALFTQHVSHLDDEIEARVRKALLWLLGQQCCREWLAKGLREQSLLDTNGRLLRCDLLYPLNETEFLLIDYKSGHPKNEYITQMQNYEWALEESGKSVRGVLVFLDLERFQCVDGTRISPLLTSFSDEATHIQDRVS
ncbi:MAG: UvrD-helicase domain-containing protein [Desulfovibrio sp.]|nr:UvrD-helicase domain-containing protein [Desulfovibrio sp.]